VVDHDTPAQPLILPVTVQAVLAARIERQGLAAVRATGLAVGMSGHLAHLAEAYMQVGQVDEGMHLLAEALALPQPRQGKRAEARELLAEIYGWFSEGFDTADLQEAKAFLETLA
jgi:hypothetical protein